MNIVLPHNAWTITIKARSALYVYLFQKDNWEYYSFNGDTYGWILGPYLALLYQTLRNHLVIGYGANNVQKSNGSDEHVQLRINWLLSLHNSIWYFVLALVIHKSCAETLILIINIKFNYANTRIQFHLNSPIVFHSM